jgi:hypothetical protein
MELGGREWRHERQRVDLAVGMVQRDPYLFALVLEDVDVGDLCPLAQGLVSISPDIDQQAYSFDRELGEGRRMLRRVDDHLATHGWRPHHTPSLAIGPECGKSVLENDDLVGVKRYLGCAPNPARTERTEVSRQESSVVPLRRIRDPLLAQRVEAEVRHRSPK